MKKKVKLIMLPTKGLSKFGYIHESGIFHFYTNGENPHDIRDNLAIPQHLYLISDDEIKEGDYMLVDFKQIGRYWIERVVYVDGENIKGHYGDVYNRIKDQRIILKKVIASTNPKLINRQRVDQYYNLKKGVEDEDGKDYWITTYDMPQIPESFIKAYVEANGEIDEVMVEYELIGTGLVHSPSLLGELADYAGVEKYKLKLTDNNEVIIISPSPIDELIEDQMKINKKLSEKMYSRNEVVKLLKGLSDEVNSYSNFGGIGNKDIDKWIEENL